MNEHPQNMPVNRHADGYRSLALVEPSGANEAQVHSELDLQGILHVLWTRRYWALAAAALGIAIALGISLLQTPLYRSTAVLELNPPTVPIMPGKGEDGTLAVANTDQEYLATQYGLLKSRTLAERVAQNLNLTKALDADADLSPSQRQRRVITTLTEDLDVEPVRASRLVELHYTSEDPASGAKIVNGFADAFMQTNLERQFAATASARSFLSDRIKTVRLDLNEAERKLVEYAKANNIILTGGTGGEDGEDGSSAGTLSGASLVALNAALAQAQQKRIAAEKRYQQASSITEVNQSAAALRQERARLQAEYQEKAQTFQEDYPVMVSLRSRIQALDSAIRSESGGASGALRAEYQAALAEEASLKARVQQLSSNVLDQRERSIQYNILQRELDTNRSLYDALLERFNQVSVTSGVSASQASIVDRGAVPTSPASPNIPLNLAIGLLLGTAIGVTLIFLYEFLTDTIKTPEDVREKLHLPPLGVIPKSKKKEQIGVELEDTKSPLTEAYASLLTTLQFTTTNGMPSSLLVTSTHPAEGKSTTSFALAQSLAGLGKSVLLLDADMRRPSFVVEERSDIGLSRLLVAPGNVTEHILKASLDNLWLMPSGPVPPNPAQLLNSARMGEIMNGLREFFDVVIVDAPPTHGFADTTLLASVCDGVLMIVKSGHTRRRDALGAIIKLQGSGSLILGVGLTQYQSVIGEYGYGYGYYESYQSIEAKPRKYLLAAQLMKGGE